MKNWRTIQDASGITLLQRRIAPLTPNALAAWETVAAGDGEVGEVYCCICFSIPEEKSVIEKFCDKHCRG
ncbi:MAG: hypothetical protein WCQ16_12255 [Verrucomicrobiae bacterium]